MSLRRIKHWFKRNNWDSVVRRRFLRDFFKTSTGKKVLSELTLHVMLGMDPFKLGSGDPQNTAYHSGRQSVVNYLLDIAGLTDRELVEGG